MFFKNKLNNLLKIFGCKQQQKNGEQVMETEGKKIAIVIEYKTVKQLEALFGVKEEAELAQLALDAFSKLLELRVIPSVKSVETNHENKIIESPASKIHTGDISSSVLSHTDKSSDGKVTLRHDATGKPIVENQMITDPKSIPEKAQRELERIRKDQEARQKEVLARKKSNRPMSRTSMV
jgi:hypothetical protein